MWMAAMGFLGRDLEDGGLVTNANLGKCPKLQEKKPENLHCPDKSRMKWVPLSMEHIQNVAIIYVAGIALALLAFIFEVTGSCYRQYRQNRKKAFWTVVKVTHIYQYGNYK